MMNYAGQCFELEQWFQPFGAVLPSHGWMNAGLTITGA